jgi:hypothetical protein
VSTPGPGWLARLVARFGGDGRVQPDPAEPDEAEPEMKPSPPGQNAPQQGQVAPERAPGPDDDDRAAFPGEFSGYPHAGARPNAG